MNSLIRSLTVALPLLAALASPSAADVVTLNAGAERFGDLLAVTSEEVRLRTGTGEVAFPLAEVLDVGFMRSYGVAGESTTAEVADPVVRAALAAPPGRADYPTASSVDLLREKTVEFKPDGTIVAVKRRVTAVLQERGRDDANLLFSYFPDEASVEVLFARSLGANGIFPATDLATSLEATHGSVPLYDRMRTLKCAIPEVNEGSILDWAVRTTHRPPTALRPFREVIQFESSEPAKRIRVRVRRPAGMKLATVFEPRGLTVQVTETTAGGVDETLYEATDVPAILEENSMPPAAYVTAGLEFAPAAEWTALGAAWTAAAEPEFQAVAAPLAPAAAAVAGIPGDRTKAVALFDRFVRDIALADVPQEDYAFVPVDLARRLGMKLANGLDKSALYVALCRAAGLSAEVVLTASRAVGPFRSGLPGLDAFDGAGVLLHPKDGADELVFPLDDTLRFGVVPSELQGATLFRPVTGALSTVPVDTPARSGQDETAFARLLPDGTLLVTSEVVFRGVSDAAMRGFKDQTDEEIQKIFEGEVAKVHPRGRLVSVAFDHLKDPGSDIHLRLVARYEDYVTLAGDRLRLLHVPGLSHDASDVGKPTRRHPLFFEGPNDGSFRIALTVPAGWKPAYLPEARIESGPGYSYVAAFGLTGRTIHFHEENHRSTLDLPAEGYGAWKAFVESRAAFANEWIVLEK